MPPSLLLLLQVEEGGPRGWVWLLVGLLVGFALGWVVHRWP